MSLIRVHKRRAGKLAYSEVREVHGAGFSVNQLPNEILTIILGLFIHDYFSFHRNLSERPPAPLHVCRKWRQLAISTPACWSYLKVHVNTQSKMKYARRNISRRDTKSKAMQDTLNCYFRWAKDHPVDLSIDFSHHFGSGVKNALIHWISGNMPKLRSYREEGHFGLFLTVLPAISADCFSELTGLHITRPRYDSEIVHSVSMPKLRTLQLTSDLAPHHDFIVHLDSPNLRALYIGVDDSSLIQTVTLLERFTLLTELAISNHHSMASHGSVTAVHRPLFSHLRRIIIVGHVFKTILFISNCRSLFPEIRDWTIDSLFAADLSKVQFTEDLAINCVETLSILCPYCPFVVRSAAELNGLWNYFPNIVHLTLRTIPAPWSFEFAGENEVNTSSTEIGWAMENLIKSLSLEDSLSPRRCPELKTIEVLNSDLSLDALDSLLDILKLRSSNTLNTAGSGGEDIGCRLTIKRSKYFYCKKESVSVEVQNSSHSEFESLVGNLRDITCSADSESSDLDESWVPDILFDRAY